MRSEIDGPPMPEIKYGPEVINVTTGTFYPKWAKGGGTHTADNLRGNLAIRSLEAAEKEGYQVLVVDGGSSREFLAELAALKVRVEAQLKNGMSAGRMQGFEQASRNEGSRVIVWTEPEKVSFVGNIALASKPILDGRADVVVPARDQAAFDTYPSYQAEFEQKANEMFNNILRKAGLLGQNDPDLDAWFGPRLFANKPELVKIFTTQYQFEQRGSDLDKIVKPELWANAIFLPLLKSLNDGYKVVSVPVNYRHPSEQTAMESDSPEFYRKRQVQLRNIITSAIHMVRQLQGSPKGRLRLVE